MQQFSYTGAGYTLSYNSSCIDPRRSTPHPFTVTHNMQSSGAQTPSSIGDAATAIDHHDYEPKSNEKPQRPTSVSSDASGYQPASGDVERANVTRFISQAEKDTIIVHWEGEKDKENPFTWSRAYRWYLTFLGGLLVLNSTFTSSAPSGIVTDLEAYFGFSQEIATLCIAIFVAGYCVGPILWGPLSEEYGRKPVLAVSMFCYTCFNVGCALSKNTASILVFRFLAGTFASAPLTASGGLISDLWDAKTRGIALSLFSLAPFAGPALGPIVSGFISVTGTNWRWLFWVCTIFSGVCLLLIIFTLRETYAPVLLLNKASKLRKETGDDRYKAPMELKTITMKQRAFNVIVKPFKMLFEEPMLLFMTLYMSYVYGIIYLLFEAYPIVFTVGHGFNAGISGLMFIPLFLGGATGVAIYVFVFNPIYSRKADKLKAEGINRVPPEERLYLLMIAGPSLVIAFFWFGWTSFPEISFWSPMMAGSLLGFAVLFVFLGVFNYLIDVYLANAATALAASTICRSAAGAGFPMFASQMYNTLNPQWASSLLGFLALIMVPVPFLLYKYGPKVRSMSKNAM